MERNRTDTEIEISRLAQRAHDAWSTEYKHHLNWDVVCVANLTVKSIRNGKRIIHLIDEVLNMVAKRMNTHLHVFFGTRECQSKRPHLHLVIMTEEGSSIVGDSLLVLEIQRMWEKYGDYKRQDVDTARGGNFMGYVINKNDGTESHFLDRFYCPKTGTNPAP